MKRFNFAILFSITTFAAFAQDPFFTNQGFGTSMINPALTGSTGMLRAETGYRLQWPKLAGNYQTQNLSAEMYYRAGAIGMNMLIDNAGGIISTFRNDLNLSHPFRLWKDTATGKAKVVIQPGFQFSYQMKWMDWDKLNFGDAIDPRRGFVYGTNEMTGKTSVLNLDIAAGLLIMSERVSAGGAVFHILEPNESFLGGNSPLPMRFVLHASGVIGNIDPREPREFRLVPSVIYMKQGNFQQLAGFVTAHYQMASLGIGYRNQDALLFSAGYTYSHFKLSYSYDYTISKLRGYTGGSHELHLGFTFFEDKWIDSRTNMRMYY